MLDASNVFSSREREAWQLFAQRLKSAEEVRAHIQANPRYGLWVLHAPESYLTSAERQARDEQVAGYSPAPLPKKTPFQRKRVILP